MKYTPKIWAIDEVPHQSSTAKKKKKKKNKLVARLESPEPTYKNTFCFP